MIRAGVPQTVAMSSSGHRTIAMFNRHNIASQDDKREALFRTEAHLAATPSERNLAAIVGHGQITDKLPSKTEKG